MEVLVACLCWWFICDISGPSGLVGSSVNFFFFWGGGGVSHLDMGVWNASR